MTKSELAAKMQENGAWLPGKTIKLDFGGDDGAIMLDGKPTAVSERRRRAPTPRSRSAGTTGRRWPTASSTG